MYENSFIINSLINYSWPKIQRWSQSWKEKRKPNWHWVKTGEACTSSWEFVNNLCKNHTICDTFWPSQNRLFLTKSNKLFFHTAYKFAKNKNIEVRKRKKHVNTSKIITGIFVFRQFLWIFNGMLSPTSVYGSIKLIDMSSGHMNLYTLGEFQEKWPINQWKKLPIPNFGATFRRSRNDALSARQIVFWLKIKYRTRCTRLFCPETTDNGSISTF